MRRVRFIDLTANTPELGIDSNLVFRPVGGTHSLPCGRPCGVGVGVFLSMLFVN
jgi:hypothetical protein